MHISVLQNELIRYLAPKPNENFIDCTFGWGGHSAAILEKNKPAGKVLGIEADSELYQALKLQMAEIQNRLILVNDNFVNLKKIVEKEKFRPISGIFFDLGMSSWHLEKSKKGFSFLRNEPLDMRFSKDENLTAEKIINEFSEEELIKILKEYGEERFSKRIAREIIKERRRKPIKTTFQLVEVLKKIIPGNHQHGRILRSKHFATRTFQALRIAVNNELENLKKALSQAEEILDPKARLAVISFHSLEDRIVKNFFKEKSRENLIKIITKKPITPSDLEIKINPRSRSAKLRVAIKTK